MSNEAESTRSTTPSLLRSSAVVGAMTMLSRVFGLLRDVVIARFIGATGHADAFFIAFRIPQFLRRLFSEGAFSQAFVPVLSEYREAGNIAATKALLNAVCGALGGTLFFLVVLVVMAAPLVTALFAPGFIDEPEKFSLTTDMLRITFPYLLLISLTGFAGAVLNTYDRFVVPAFTPVLLNLSLIGFALWLSPLLNEPVFALAWAVLFAGVAQLLFQLPFLQRLHLLPRPCWDWSHPGVKRVLTLMLPAIFGVSVSQINLLLDTVLASLLPTGSVSWLYYSDRLVELPLGVIGIAIATVILPSLSRIPRAEQSHETVAQFSETVAWAIRSVVAVALPATAALIVLASPILYTLFQYQAMTASDVAMSSLSLRMYALGLLAFMLIKVLATAYYSRQDMKTPVKIGIIAMVSNMFFNLILVFAYHYYWQVGHVGLALATALSAFINAGLLFRGLVRRGLLVSADIELSIVGRVVLATAAMTLLLCWMTPPADFWPSASFLQRALQVVWLCAAGFCAYLLAALALGLRWRHFASHSVVPSSQ